MRARNMFIACLLFASPAYAVSIEPPLANAAQEAIARQAIAQLRCVVCEGQSLADSDAGFAREMRNEVRRMASEGQSEREILAYFRDRYGATILLTPPVEGDTLLLWAGPALLLVLGGALVWRHTARRRA